ncbi:MAG: hypothetical protein PHH11_11595 [Methylomonas sp.]|nr:hypothetical protein [Methylomonas sp.]
MKSVVNYIDECKIKTGSDNATAIAIGVERTVITKIRSRAAISDENAVKIAELLGIDPGEVLLAAAMARSHGAVRSAWENVSKRAGIAASIFVACMLIFPAGKAEAKNLTMYTLYEAKEAGGAGFALTSFLPSRSRFYEGTSDTLKARADSSLYIAPCPPVFIAGLSLVIGRNKR